MSDKEDRQEQPFLLEDDGTDVSVLFSQALRETAEHLSDEQAISYLSSVLEGTAVEGEDLLFERIAPERVSHLSAPSYQPDRAMREASLAPKEYWKENNEGELSYVASNEFEVYLGSVDHPLEIREVLQEIRKLNESTVLTARIVLGLWNSRRYNKQVSRDGSVAILLDEILQWQGTQKHSRVVHPGSAKRYTEGYRTEQKRHVLQDMELLASCHVRGSSRILFRGKATTIEIDGPYLRYSTVSRKSIWEEPILLGFLVAPGGWIGTYEEQQNSLFAQIDSQIFRLNPQNDRYALRIALYLTERWREQAKDGAFSTPLVMTDLLSASMISIDKRHINEFAPAIEKSLLHLERMGVIGKQQCLAGFHVGVDNAQTHTCMKIHQESSDKAEVNPCSTALISDQTRWSKDWLASRWEILPPLSLIQAYQPKIERRKRGRPRKNESTTK